MQYSVPDAARILNVTEETIYRFIREENFPAVQFNGQFHVNQQRLIEWAHERHISLTLSNGEGLPSLGSALRAGDVLRKIPGATKREILHIVTERMPFPEDADREFLFDMIWSREQSGSTGFGNGIAIPHARRPIIMGAPHASMTIAYLDKPVDFGAMDGQPVHTLFLLVTPTVRIHLHLLARLGVILQDVEFLNQIRNQSAKGKILEYMNAWENGSRSGS